MVRTIYKFLRLPAADRRLLVQAASFLVAIRVGLWLLSFPTLRRLLATITRPRAVQAVDHASISHITWAVAAASRYLPGAMTCLAQALAVQALLRRRGHPNCLRIGVARSPEGELQAHAWVESEGRVVIGGLEDLARYIPLPPLEREKP